ncbi:uncharacterized protein [Panulirus ornatus]|uniref:uncharacterized protein n=1 Tax=Panulirus ornatus TaxID=150431 RepID=UPI003A8481A0
MDIDQHLMWYISALKASVDGGAVNENKLIRNVGDCFLRVKKACFRGNKDQQFEDFRVRATLLLLLCCPRIQQLPVIQNCRDFQSIIMTLPVLKESFFFSVVRSQKNYLFLAPVLCWVSPTVLEEIAREFFICIDEVTPVTLAIALELVKVLLFSCQHNKYEDGTNIDNMECLILLLRFLSSKNISNETQALVKSSGYYYMYLCKFVHLMLTVYAGHCLKEPQTYPFLQVWTSLWKNKEHVVSTKHCDNSIRGTIRSLLDLCQQNSIAITVDVWMEWNDLILPVSVTVHRNSSVLPRKAQSKSIQAVICNVAFDIMRLFNSHPEMTECLETIEYKGLLQFFTQVQSDPNYDPDQDLSLDQLVKEISLRDESEGKLLGILIKKDDIFSSQICQECLKEHGTMIDNDTRQDLLVRFIQYIRAGGHCSPEWLDTVVSMAADIPCKQLLEVIENHLAGGLDETLKTADFSNQLTTVFNQLAGQDSVVPSGKHIWLCLQSGKSVVEHAVKLPVTLSGLVPVIVQALTAIPQVCQAILPSGTSLLVSTLLEQQKTGLSGKEEREFVALVKGLLRARNVLAASDVMQMLIEPFLMVTGGKDLDKLTLPLDLLKEIVEHEPSAVIMPGPPVVSLLLILVHIIQATVNLQSLSASSTLTLRIDAISVLNAIVDTFLSNIQLYEKDISLLKQLIVKYKLHPRCILPLSRVLDIEDCQESFTDQVLHAIMKMEFALQQGKQPDFDNTDEAFENLAGISRSQWIIALLELLPHSSESEWTSAFFLTHHVLQSEQMVYPTLQIFQEVLYFLCAHLTCSSMDEKGELNSGEYVQPVSLPIQHCFKCFASGTMVYVEKMLCLLPSDNRFQCISSIFKWWCRQVSLYQCNPELPSLFLFRLCSALEELVASGTLKVSLKKTESDTCTGNHLHLNGMEEIRTLNGFKEKVVDKAKNMVNGEEHTPSTGYKDDQKDNEGKVNAKFLSSQNRIKLNNGCEGEEICEERDGEVNHETSGLLEDKKETLILEDGTSIGKEMSRNKFVENYCGENSHKNSVKISDNTDNYANEMKKGRLKTNIAEICCTDFKREIEELIISLVKHVPVSSLVASIASKLKKLYEL